MFGNKLISIEPRGMDATKARETEIIEHHARHAGLRDLYIQSNGYYYGLVARLLRFICAPDKSVLHVGCQTGHLLSKLSASRAVGLDQTRAMLDLARTKHPSHEYQLLEDQNVPDIGTFDYILTSNTGECTDILNLFKNLEKCMSPKSLHVIYQYNRAWELIIMAAEWFGLKYKTLGQNWLSGKDIDNFLSLAGYETLKVHRAVLFPKRIPIASWVFNEVLAKLPFFRSLCMVEVVVAQKIPVSAAPDQFTASVIVPCKNEEGNIEEAVKRIPELGRGTEIIFCDDKSEDDTVEAIKGAQKKYPEKTIRLVTGPGVCKSKNVWTGFDAATGDILMILDADLTVMPEQLPDFFDALVSGRGRFINGTRLVYPMQHQAMRVLNIFGNIFFSRIFTFILGQRITDTLCGTKVFWREDWPSIKGMVDTWGVSDRWGDFDLLFGAAKLHLKIIELPVHYQRRVEGQTKMTNRLKNAAIMGKMCIAAFNKFR